MLLGNDSATAGRQAAVLFAISGLSTLLGLPTVPGRWVLLSVLAIADLSIAGVAWLAPSDRSPLWVVSLLTLPGFLVLGLTTWGFSGFASGTGPLFVLVFVWLGLHQSNRVILANVVPAAVSYITPLWVIHPSPRIITTAAVLLTLSCGVALLTAAQMVQLRSQRDRWERADQWRAALVATLAHDVRGPLTTIDGSLQMLEDMPALAEGERLRMVRAARRQTSRLGRLAADLLDVERVEQGKLRLRREQVAVAEAATRAAGQSPSGDDVRIEVDPDLQVSADPHRLDQILVNLVSNARRHGRPPIVINASRADDGTVSIEVRDHGDGVAQQVAGRLFERLGEDTSEPGSVGLGMWIVRLLTEAHGGTVAYRPASPGAVFEVRFPASTQSNVARHGKPSRKDA